jgi:hypothetical protein
MNSFVGKDLNAAVEGFFKGKTATVWWIIRKLEAKLLLLTGDFSPDNFQFFNGALGDSSSHEQPAELYGQRWVESDDSDSEDEEEMVVWEQQWDLSHPNVEEWLREHIVRGLLGCFG